MSLKTAGLLAALAMLAYPGVGYGAKWVPVSGAQDSSESVRTYLDIGSISYREKDFVRAWTKSLSRAAAENRAGEQKERLSYAEYDCAGRRLRVLSTEGRDKNGATISAEDLGEGTWTAITPGSPVEGVLKLLCTK